MSGESNKRKMVKDSTAINIVITRMSHEVRKACNKDTPLYVITIIVITAGGSLQRMVMVEANVGLLQVSSVNIKT